jgi:hypothetical protein
VEAKAAGLVLVGAVGVRVWIPDLAGVVVAVEAAVQAAVAHLQQVVVLAILKETSTQKRVRIAAK